MDRSVPGTVRGRNGDGVRGRNGENIQVRSARPSVLLSFGRIPSSDVFVVDELIFSRNDLSERWFGSRFIFSVFAPHTRADWLSHMEH